MLHAKTFNWAKYEDVRDIHIIGIDANNAADLANAITLRLQRLEGEMKEDDEHAKSHAREFVLIDIDYTMSTVAYGSRSAVITYGYTTEVIIEGEELTGNWQGLRKFN